jgi:MFS transporter, FHS family, glucose/mannose:H+ symporter
LSPDSTRNRIALVFTINACMFIFGIVLFLMGALLPTLHVNYAHAINLGSVPLIGILIATVFAGPVLDLHGAKQMMIVALLVIAGSLAIFPALRLYWQLEACCLSYGLGGGILNTATNVLIADLNAESRASALNLLGFFFSGGAVLAPLLMSAVGDGLPSSTVLRLLAGVTASIVIPVIAFRFPPPLRAGIRLRNLFTVLDQPLVWLFGVILIFESGSENCVFVWSGKIVTDVLHTTPARGSLALAALGAALGIGRLAAILWLRWLGNLGMIWLSAALILTGISIAIAEQSLSGMIFAMAVIGFGISAIFPTILGIAGDRFSGETGTVFGAIIALGLLGGAAGPTVGAHAARYGPLHVLLIPAVCAVAVGVLAAVVNSPLFSAPRDTTDAAGGPTAGL